MIKKEIVCLEYFAVARPEGPAPMMAIFCMVPVLSCVILKASRMLYGKMAYEKKNKR